ncbi:hypothetical protein GCM10020219_098530 [Nonomuraea dietziae]
MGARTWSIASRTGRLSTYIAETTEAKATTASAILPGWSAHLVTFLRLERDQFGRDARQVAPCQVESATGCGHGVAPAQLGLQEPPAVQAQRAAQGPGRRPPA